MIIIHQRASLCCFITATADENIWIHHSGCSTVVTRYERSIKHACAPSENTDTGLTWYIQMYGMGGGAPLHRKTLVRAGFSHASQDRGHFKEHFLSGALFLYFFLNYLEVSSLITSEYRSVELLETALSEAEILDKYTNFEALSKWGWINIFLKVATAEMIMG